MIKPNSSQSRFQEVFIKMIQSTCVSINTVITLYLSVLSDTGYCWHVNRKVDRLIEHSSRYNADKIEVKCVGMHFSVIKPHFIAAFIIF